MCRAPESREQHLRLEQELLALANNEDCLHALRTPQQAREPRPLMRVMAARHSASRRLDIVQTPYAARRILSLSYAPRVAQSSGGDFPKSGGGDTFVTVLARPREPYCCDDVYRRTTVDVFDYQHASRVMSM
jgi:hypothetical protein